MKRLMLNFHFTWLSIFILGVQIAHPQESQKTTEQYHFTDWFQIRSSSKPLPKKIIIDGYISFDGVGDFPTITLWDSIEGLEQKRTYHQISIDSESASTIINDAFGWGVDSWGVLQGLFVEIEGEFSRQESGLEYLEGGLGKISSIKKITVKNNGRVLLLLEQKI